MPVDTEFVFVLKEDLPNSRYCAIMIYLPIAAIVVLWGTVFHALFVVFVGMVSISCKSGTLVSSGFGSSLTGSDQSLALTSWQLDAAEAACKH